jgi:hypothetical protein
VEAELAGSDTVGERRLAGSHRLKGSPRREAIWLWSHRIERGATQSMQGWQAAAVNDSVHEWAHKNGKKMT